MREIKFRAWDIEEDFMAKEIQTMYDGYCIDIETSDKYGWMSSFYGFFEDRYILMRYTGLNDKNEVNIYEGDIVKHKNGGLCSVKWLENECRFALVKMPGEFEIYKTNHSLWRMCEVVGNIYENHKLLKELNK